MFKWLKDLFTEIPMDDATDEATYQEWRSSLTNRQQGWLGKNVDEDVTKVLVEMEQRIYLLEHAARAKKGKV